MYSLHIKHSSPINISQEYNSLQEKHGSNVVSLVALIITIESRSEMNASTIPKLLSNDFIIRYRKAYVPACVLFSNRSGCLNDASFILYVSQQGFSKVALNNLGPGFFHAVLVSTFSENLFSNTSPIMFWEFFEEIICLYS